MAKTNRFPKDPDEILDYSINYTNELQSGETISSSEWEEETGITIVTDTNTSAITTVWLSGGTDNEVYKIKNTVVTNAVPQARTFVKSLIIVVNEN